MPKARNSFDFLVFPLKWELDRILFDKKIDDIVEWLAGICFSQTIHLFPLDTVSNSHLSISLGSVVVHFSWNIVTVCTKTRSPR